MKDIARDLDLSVVSVSKALRNHEDISAETRERVLKRALELDYQPNLAAKSLATGRSYLMGLVVPDLVHPFFSQVAKGASRVLRPHGYNLIISSSEEDPDLENEELRAMIARNLDVCMVSSAQRSPDTFRHFLKQKRRFILVDRTFDDLDAHYVGTDDVATGHLATGHLIESGCRRIACIAGKEGSTSTQRVRGYVETLRAHGFNVPSEYIVTGRQMDNLSEVSAFEAMERLLDLNPRPDGVFCVNDPTAMGAMQAILERGLRIPQEIAVIGCGNVHYASQLRVPLTSIDQSSEGIGEAAAKLALNLMDSNRVLQEPKRIILEPRLVVRESTRRA